MSVEFAQTEDMDALLKEMDKESEEGKYVSPFWVPKVEGVTPLRVIPQLKTFDESIFYQKYRLHYINSKPYVCLNQTLKSKDGTIHEAESCPICRKTKQLYDLAEGNKDSEEWKLAGSISAKDRFICRAVIRGKKDAKGNDDEATPVFYEFGKKIHEIFYQAIKLNECGNFLSLKDGRDFNLSKKGTGKGTDYSGSSLSMKQTPIFTDKAKLEKLLAALPKMEYNQLLEFKSSKELENALAELFREENEEKENASFPADKGNATSNDSISIGDDIDSMLSAPVLKTDEKTSIPDDIESLLNSGI